LYLLFSQQDSRHERQRQKSRMAASKQQRQNVCVKKDKGQRQKKNSFLVNYHFSDMELV
jgi:hypothetical protein